jgi:molybdopterin converting factor small subunit
MTAGTDCTIGHDGVDATVAVTVRYFAGARAAAGVPEETVRVARAGGPTTVADVIAAALTLHPDRLAHVVPSCSFLLDGVAVRDHGRAVDDGAFLDVLPPFAGG